MNEVRNYDQLDYMLNVKMARTYPLVHKVQVLYVGVHVIHLLLNNFVVSNLDKKYHNETWTVTHYKWYYIFYVIYTKHRFQGLFF